MKAIERLAVWFGGYSSSAVASDFPEERERIAKVGAAVIFAVAIAMMNWGVAGWVFVEGMPTAARFLVVFVAATIGASSVLLLDRSFLFFHDTSEAGNGIKTALYALTRILMILIIGSVTAQAIIPLILKDELQIHALHMIEDHEKDRFSELNVMHNVDDKREAVKSESEKLRQLEKAASVIPPHIQLKISGANKCWQEYGNEKSKLIATGYAESDARHSMSWKAATCSRETNAANQERNSYVNLVRVKQKEATEELTRLRKDFDSTTSRIKGKMENANKIESDSLNFRSSIVLWNLLRNNHGALIKWAFISILLIIFELLPLILKLHAGQSNIGRKKALLRYLHKLDMECKKIMCEHDFNVTRALYQTSDKSVVEALNSQTVMESFKTHFVRTMSAVAPFEAVRSMMAEFERMGADVEAFMYRHPRYAKLIFQAWTKAIEDSANIIAGTQNVNANI